MHLISDLIKILFGFLFRCLFVTPLGLEPRTPTLRTDSKTRTCDIIHLTISVISVIDFKVNRELFKCCALPTELRGQLKKPFQPYSKLDININYPKLSLPRPFETSFDVSALYPHLCSHISNIQHPVLSGFYI